MKEMKLERWKNIEAYNKYMETDYKTIDELEVDANLIAVDIIRTEDGAFLIDYYGEWKKEDLE